MRGMWVIAALLQAASQRYCATCAYVRANAALSNPSHRCRVRLCILELRVTTSCVQRAAQSPMACVRCDTASVCRVSSQALLEGVEINEHTFVNPGVGPELGEDERYDHTTIETNARVNLYAGTATYRGLLSPQAQNEVHLSGPALRVALRFHHGPAHAQVLRRVCCLAAPTGGGVDFITNLGSSNMHRRLFFAAADVRVTYPVHQLAGGGRNDPPARAPT